MKKVLSLLMALIIVLSFSSLSFADDACPLLVTKDGKAAAEGSEGDYYYDAAGNVVIIRNSGLKVSMPKGVESAACSLSVSGSQITELTLEKLVLMGPDCYLSVFSSQPVSIKLVGENKVISESKLLGMALLTGDEISFEGRGSLFATTDYLSGRAILPTAELVLGDGISITGSDGSDEFGPVEYRSGENNKADAYVLEGTDTACRSILISGKRTFDKPLLPVLLVIIIIAIVSWLRKDSLTAKAKKQRKEEKEKKENK